MARDARLFAPFDIGMDEHPKIIGLSDAAFRAFFEGVFYARRSLSDGFLDRRIVLRKWGQEVADELSTNDPDRPSWVAVDNGWQIRDFGNHHPLRADIEGKREQTSEAKAAAGRRSGEARRAKREAELNTAEQNTNTTRTEPNRTRTNGNPETETETETETEQTTPSSTSGERKPKSIYSDAFEAWYARYPRKQSKGDAFKAWESLRKAKVLPDMQTLCEATERYAQQVAGREPKFMKLPGGWLRDHKWGDEEPPTFTTPAAIGKGHERDLAWEAQLERARAFDAQQEQHRLEIQQ